MQINGEKLPRNSLVIYLPECVISFNTITWCDCGGCDFCHNSCTLWISNERGGINSLLSIFLHLSVLLVSSSRVLIHRIRWRLRWKIPNTRLAALKVQEEEEEGEYEDCDDDDAESRQLLYRSNYVQKYKYLYVRRTERYSRSKRNLIAGWE